MIYIFGIIGFILGFFAGLYIIHLFLKHYPASQLVKDKSLRWTYGLSVWIFGGFGAWGGVWFFERSIF